MSPILTRMIGAGSAGSGFGFGRRRNVGGALSLDGSSSILAAGSPLQIANSLGTTPSTGVYWFKNPGYNSNTPFECLADWSVYSSGVMILCGTNITDNSTRSFFEFGTAATSSSGTIGFRNNYYVPSYNILSNWSGDTANRFMAGMTPQSGTSILNSSNGKWHVMNVTPSTASSMFDNAPGTAEFTGSVSASSSGTTGTFYWSTSHGGLIYQMATSSDTVNSNLWMETRVGGSDGNHSPIVYGNNNGTYYIVNSPYSSRWMFMGFSPNNIIS